MITKNGKNIQYNLENFQYEMVLGFVIILYKIIQDNQYRITR